MMGIIEYKGYHGQVEFDEERLVLTGKILFINDLVTFEASDGPSIKAEFEAAVDDYLDTCASLGRSPQKPFNGQFNVRLGPELHRCAVIDAAKSRITLNEWMCRVVRAATSEKKSACIVHQHQVTVTVDGPGLEVARLLATSAEPSGWKTPGAFNEYRAH